MKNKLLALMALCGATSSTMPLWAAWEDPQLSFVTPDFDAIQKGSREVYYLYHVASGMFMSNSSTACAVAADGQEVTLSYGTDYELASHAVDASDYSDAQSYRLSMMNAPTNGGFHELYLNGDGVLYVDHNKTGHILWDILPQDDGTYRLQVNQDDPTYGASNATYAGALVGVNQSEGKWNTSVNPLIIPGTAGFEGAAFDWKFVEPEVYEVYKAKLALQAQLEAADEQGFSDYADYATLYNSDNATPEALYQAVEDLKTDLVDFGLSHATPDSPVDVTERYVKEPSFANSMDGWEVVQGPGPNYQRKVGDRFQDGAGSLPEGVALENFYECYNGSGNMPNWSITQRLSGLPDGKYRVGAWILTNRLPTEDEPNTRGLFLSATTLGGQTRVEATHAASESNSGRGYGTWGHYTVDFDVIGGTATIGLVVEGANTNWTAVDDFTLEYMGPGVTADVREVVKNNIAQIERNYTDYVENAKHGAAEDEAYKSILAVAKEAVENAEVANDSLTNLILSLQSSYDAMAATVSQYEALNTQIDNLWAVWEDNEAYVNVEMSEYEAYIGELQEAYDAGTFDMAELDSIQPRGNKLLKECIMKALADGRTDNVTGLLVNPNFDGSNDGWTKTGDGDFKNEGTRVTEVWNGRNWEVYQELRGLPQGSYKVSVQGFYSPSSQDKNYWQENYGMEGDQTNDIHGFLFGNDASTPLVHVMSCPQDEKLTDDMDEITWGGESVQGKFLTHGKTSAQTVFELSPGNYYNEVVCYVGADGVLRIGTSMSNVEWDAAWVVFDNFQVTYLGADVMDGATSALEALVREATTLLNAETLSTTETRDALGQAIEKASAVLGGTLTPEVYTEESTALREAMTAEQEAVAAATALETKTNMHNDKLLGDGVGSYAEYAGTAAYDELENLVISLFDRIDAGTFASMAEIEELGVALDKTYSKMVSASLDFSVASKDEPMDVTALIVNPEFESQRQNESGEIQTSRSAEGWVGASVDDGQLSKVTGAFNYEIFNDSSEIHQTLYNMPAGYYRVVLNGFYRAGGYVEAALARRDSVGGMPLNAEVYLQSGAQQWTEKMPSIFDDVREFTKYTGDVFLADSLLPDMSNMVYRIIVNDVNGANSAFNAGAYETSLVFHVAEGEEPVLGVRKTGVITNDWLCFDNFRLYYYGDGDANKPDGFEDSIDDVAAEGTATVVGSTWTTLNGMKIAEPKQRGIYIRVDKMSDGTSRAVKVLVR